MKVIIPHDIKLLTAPFAEDDVTDGTAWDTSTTYTLGDKVRHEHVSYSSLGDNNKGNDPSKTWSGVGAKWQKIEATMPYRLVDEYVETQTIGQEGQPFTFSAPFNRANAFALLNLEGYTARAVVTDDEEGEYFNQEYWLIRDISDFSLFEYNYYPIDSKTNLVATDIPMPITGQIEITLDPGEGEKGKVGMFVVGRQENLGKTQYGAEVGITDYSRKNVDEFGRTSLIKRSFSTPLSLPVYLHPRRLDYVTKILTSVRGTPCIWVGDNRDEGFSSLTVYGWLEDFRAVVEGPNEIQLSLEIQGLV